MLIVFNFVKHLETHWVRNADKSLPFIILFHGNVKKVSVPNSLEKMLLGDKILSFPTNWTR